MKFVERRKEHRLKVSKAVILKVLDRMSGPSMGRPMQGRVVDISGIGIRLCVPHPIPCGAAIEIIGGSGDDGSHDGAHLLILGEVCRCVPEQGAYTVGIRMFQTLGAAEARQAQSLTRS
jgi:hypothetical protein